MEEPWIFPDPVQVGEHASVPAGFAKIDALRSNAAIITALDSTEGPILVSDPVLDYVHSNWPSQYEDLQQRVFAPDTGPTALRGDQGQIVAVTQLRSAYEPGVCDKMAAKRRSSRKKRAFPILNREICEIRARVSHARRRSI